VWNSRLPLDIRSAIDDARMERERNSPDDPFHAFDDLVIATPVVISTHVPLRVLARVLDVAERAMGFAAAPVAANPKPGNLARVALTGSRAEAAVPVARPTADGTARRAALRLPGDAAAASPPTPMSGRAEGTSPGIPLPKTAVLKKTADGTGPHAALAAVPAPVAAPAGEGETKS
jgi:hypothetical protein